MDSPLYSVRGGEGWGSTMGRVECSYYKEDEEEECTAQNSVYIIWLLGCQRTTRRKRAKEIPGARSSARIVFFYPIAPTTTTPLFSHSPLAIRCPLPLSLHFIHLGGPSKYQYNISCCRDFIMQRSHNKQRTRILFVSHFDGTARRLCGKEFNRQTINRNDVDYR